LRKAKTIEDLLQDKTMPYRVGQLIGAAEMASHWMQMQEDHATQAMGDKLADVVGWFFWEVENGSRRSIDSTQGTRSIDPLP
jgi:hypothetical protein